ncbi:hypothetical protein PHJA_000549400 [Phtheirospermum japonicum]|uniref:Bifunctional inhibitor/plant lipid transfer protein/seed storage helical domain-containing protein n=1 Tax=Phtheirospermum japonicum TaxID=374723 RepID=A0A830BG00_9LAMI|nr:hypothetical protein PHJA_000549400 [Phtheirospermum japonicum]
MEKITYSPCLLLSFAISVIFIVTPVNSQSSTICTGAMISSFSPCMNFLTSSSNSSSPTQNCCGSLKSLMSNGQDCLCLIITGGVPFKVPINRAMSLPRACKMSGVPIECKATASPVPPPDPRDPGDDGSNMPPGLSPPSPRAPFIPQPSPPSLAPEGDTIPTLTPEGNTMPTLTPPGMRPTLTTSVANPSHYGALTSHVAVLGLILFKFFFN